MSGNILLFTRCMGSGGTETVISQLAEAYRDAGYHVCVCADSGPGADKIRALGIPFYDIPDIQQKNPKVMLKVLSTLCGILRREKIDVVHTHHRMAAFYARLLKPFYSFRFLNDVHNTFTDKKCLTRFALGGAVNIAVGSAVKENMVRDYGIPESRVRVIYNAVKAPAPLVEADPLLAGLRKEGRFLVGNVGRLNTQKGFEYYIEAAKLLKTENLPITCLIIGEGVLESQIKEKVRNENLEDTVIFTGFRTDVTDVMAQCDLIVLSSLWEGFPLTPIEAFSVGRTIVATDVPGTMEIVQDGENGLIVPQKDPAALAGGIKKLYADPELRHRLEDSALQTYREKFSYEAFRDHYLNLLQELTEGETYAD